MAGKNILSNLGNTILILSIGVTGLSVIESPPNGILYRNNMSIVGPVFDACESFYRFFSGNIKEEHDMREIVSFVYDDLVNQ
ncbi:MAG: hypothetical protein KKH88_01465 [Nanoarchaeota archaeon]|nr:hypothetical protein [Nanoarchaeota archaeon]